VPQTGGGDAWLTRWMYKLPLIPTHMTICLPSPVCHGQAVLEQPAAGQEEEATGCAAQYPATPTHVLSTVLRVPCLGVPWTAILEQPAAGQEEEEAIQGAADGVADALADLEGAAPGAPRRGPDTTLQ